MFVFAKSAAPNTTLPPELRAAAAGLLCQAPAERQAAIALLTKWLAPTNDRTLQIAAVHKLAATGEETVGKVLLSHYGQLEPAVQAVIIEVLLTRESWTLDLLEKIKQGSEVTLDAVQRARVRHHSSKRVREAAEAVIKAESTRSEVIEQFRPALQLQGVAARGKVVFGTRCIACHRMDGTGVEIGPDLKSVVNHPAEKILTNIIDPSLDVQPGFFAYQCKLKDGSELYGLVTSETGNSVSFKLTDGTTRLVSRRDVAEMKSTGQSLMPAGLEAGMTPQEMADLIAWLKGDVK
jgi:putative heme-binding domain-containing protein